MLLPLDKIREIDEIETHEDRILAAARLYVAAGFYVVPIRPNGKAIPEAMYNVNYAHASNRKAIMDKWFGPNGRFKGWNIGLAAGRADGIFVVDLDVHGEQDGIAEWSNTIPAGYEFDGPVQSTPSGGRHLIFQWRENGTSSSSKIGKGIDTRGGDARSCKGHVVAWPSMINGKAYQWLQGGEVEETPDWLIDMMGFSWKSTKGTGRGNEYVDPESVEDKFSIEEISEMLQIIDPNELSYDEWLQIGMAVHSQHPDDDGKDVWDNWCKEGDRYQPNEVQVRWNGFKSTGEVRIGTIIHYAQKRGYVLAAPMEYREKDKIDYIVEEMNKEFAIVPMGSDVYVLQEKEVSAEVARFTPRYQILKKQGFKSLLENTTIATVDGAGRPVYKSHAEVWLAHPDRRTYENGVGMFPGKPKRYDGYYNMWDGFLVEPKKGKWNLFREHILNVICNGNEDLFEWVLDWMADLVQDPANPKGAAIVLSGIEGCGKGTFAHFIGQVFGTTFKHVTDEEHLVGRFNSQMMDAVVVFADEVTYGGNKKVAGKLKAMVTERYLTMEKKGVDALQFRNCVHLMIASNERWFIPAGPNSRRWLVLECSPEYANDPQYFKRMHEQMEKDGGLQAMLHELLEREINHHLGKAPETQALMNQRAESSMSSAIAAWWSEKLGTGVMGIYSPRGDDSDWPEDLVKKDIISNFHEWCHDKKRRQPSDNELYKCLQEFGLIRTRLNVGKERIYGYKVPELGACQETFVKLTGIDHREVELDED